MSEPSFEELQRELDEVVARLERGDVPLDEALALWRRGEELHRACVERLDRAELEIEELRLGEQVVLRVSSDVAEEVHVHGYDLEQAVPAGGSADIPLTASIPGVFEVELHESGKALYQLRVA